MKKPTLLGLILVFLAFTAIEQVEGGRASNGIETTREELLASRRRRSKQLEGMLVEAKHRLGDHESGAKMLDEDEVLKLRKKIDVYQKKLDTMEGDLDEREIERILRREKLRDERLKERRDRRSEL